MGKKIRIKQKLFNYNNKKKRTSLCAFSVGREGVEPSQCLHRRILSPLRLPIPPPPQQILFYLTIQQRQGFTLIGFM